MRVAFVYISLDYRFVLSLLLYIYALYDILARIVPCVVRIESRAENILAAREWPPLNYSAPRWAGLKYGND